MDDKKKLYVTTPLYYVNAAPHIGHSYTTIAADVLARFHREKGDDTFLLVGTDEHGLNIQKKAEDAKKDPQVFVDEISQEFKNYWEKLITKKQTKGILKIGRNLTVNFARKSFWRINGRQKRPDFVL